MIRWVVVNDPEKVHQIAEMTIDWMKIVKEKAPALYEEANLEVFVAAWDGGKDRISRGAPCIIMACAPKDERTAPPAAMIAIHQIQLAAPALGLGTTFTGSINTACQGYPPLIEMLGMPEGNYSTWNVRNWLSGREVPTDSCAKTSRRDLDLRAIRLEQIQKRNWRKS